MKKTITKIQPNTGEVVDGITFQHNDGSAVKVGGTGGGLKDDMTLGSGEQIVSASYTKCGYPHWRGCLSKVELKTNKGRTHTIKSEFYDAGRDDPSTTVINAPSGKHIASFKGSVVTVAGKPYLGSLDIGELGDREITTIQPNMGEVIDGITFSYNVGDAVKIGGAGGGLADAITLGSGEQVVSAAYTKCGYPYWSGCLSKVDFKTNKGKTHSIKAKFYDARRDDPDTSVVSAPAGKHIVSFKGGLTTVAGNQHLSSIEISETANL